MANDQDDGLFQKVHNFICGSGGFVELPVLFRRPAPLGSRKSAPESRKWLKNRSEFVFVKDHNGEEKGVRINLRKKICQQYVVKGSCRRGQNKCKHWHICKSFIEGECSGACGLSHDFHDHGNDDKLKELGLEKYSNGSLRKIIAWSLPTICELYLRSECKCDKCPYLHICAKEAHGVTCSCSLSHNLTDSHNMNVLKEYDLVPPNQIVNVDFVRCSILVLDKQRSLSFSEDRAAAMTPKAAPSRFKNSTAASVFFERLCKEFSCSASLANLLEQKVVLPSELEDFDSLLEESKDKFLVTRNERGAIQDVTAFCPKLRLCRDFVSSTNECRKNRCPNFHLCRKFVSGTCIHGESCSRSHSFRNKRDAETLSNLCFDGLTDEQLCQLMMSSSPQVCLDYNNSSCNRGSLCSRVHICKRFVMNACGKGRSCCLDHKRALDTLHTSSILEKYKIDDTNLNNVLRDLLVCEGHKSACGSSIESTMGRTNSGSLAGLNSLPAKDGDFVEKWLMDLEPEQNASSQTRIKAQQQKRRSSVSSSCSSVAPQNKFNPSKKTVFKSICKKHNGTVPFSIISQRRDLFSTGNSQNIANWFRQRNDKFLLTEDSAGNILQVTSFCPKARLCFNYLTSQSCSRDDCQFFHVCREFIAGSCKFFSRCKWRHNFQFDEDRGFITKLELGDLTQEELRKVLRFSMPQVCLDYNSGGCKKDLCVQIHICKDFVKRKCSDFDDCDLQHESALLTPRASAIFEKYGLTCSDASTRSMLKEVLVCENHSSRREESRSSNPSNQSNLNDDFSFPVQRSTFSVSLDSEVDDSFILPTDGNYNGSANQRALSSSRSPCFPSEQQVFHSLCTEYDCSASFSAIAKRKDLFPHGSESAYAWFRETKGSFLITDSDRENGKVAQIEAFSTKARLCLNYTSSGNCQSVDCTYLHVCKGYITDTCYHGESCSLNHHFFNKKDRALLSKIKLDLLTEQQLRKLVLLSTPQLCVEYNNGICRRGDSCPKIHMCCGYLRKSCSRKEGHCGLEHEEALSTNHSQAVLKRFKLSNVNKHEIRKMTLDDKLNLEAKDKTNCHIHHDKPDVDICPSFLVGRCHSGLRCRNHHCSLPYHWQYMDPSSRKWKSFGVKDNVALEKLYCDVSVEKRDHFKPAQVLELSLTYPKRIYNLRSGEENEISIDLDDKLMFVTLLPSRATFATNLRRLSTVAYHIWPCDYVSTMWTWYWKENGNIWQTYGKDRWGRDLQNLIEKAFLDKLQEVKQGRRFKLKFSTPEHNYELFLGTSKMYQINTETGSKRDVKRRPGKVIANEDVEDWKWTFGDSSVREQLSKTSAKYKYIPSHWSPMPPNKQYARFGLLSYEDEYKTVEKLFRRTMNDYVVIDSIERVQNPFMWEKYCRKKENMIATAMRAHETIDEKRLFHGTSPDTVEAICKQNFDWRLHGKNATMYGQGSYFAVNASYSDAFARRDSLSRQFMFLAKVLVGSYTTGHSSYRRPPLKNPLDPASDLYDSCVDNLPNPAIFVVFDTDQFYPEYIIQYSTQRQVRTAVASAYALPQPYAAPLSNLQPQQGIRTAYPTSQQSVTAPSRPAPPSSQPLRSTLTYPSRPSSTVSASIPNRSGTRSSSSRVTAAGSAVPMPQRTPRVATTSNQPRGLVTRGGYTSTTSASSSPSSSNPLSSTTIANSPTARNLNHTRVSSIHGVTPTRQGGSDEQRVSQSSAFNSTHSTPFDAKGSVTTDPPKKKKDCLIM